jgi:hydrogenase/urease accessory protein HupE
MVKPFLDDQMPDAPWVNYTNFADVHALLMTQAPNLYEVRSGKDRLRVIGVEVVWTDEDDIEFLLTYPRPIHSPVFFRAKYLDSMLGEHEATLVVLGEDNQQLAWELLSKGNDGLSIQLFEPPRSAWFSFKAFLALGIEHILTGYDHLLFLVGLLVVCGRFSSMAWVISCFTLAHSITLALSALDWVVLPGRIVEPLIALSIVYVGVENLLREPRRRWMLTFVFGLMHGFGFANVLRETRLGSEGLALIVPLFSFNLGVELGQISVAVIVLPLILILRQKARFIRFGLPAISGAVTLMGGYWFVMRVFFP